MLMVQIDKEI